MKIEGMQVNQALSRRERAEAVERVTEIRAELSDDFDANRKFIEQTYYAFQDDSRDHCAVEHLVARYLLRHPSANRGLRIHGTSQTVQGLAREIIVQRFDQFDRVTECGLFVSRERGVL